ncbi:DNA-dependent metalloprotease [Erysiphe necator]|nr:DNA-dependent metalloprotease [Erysiphe necator]
MPLGWERINTKKSSPNKNVVFIKPRPGPDESTSQKYLERIAAQCVPIMKKHHLYVVTLEEYEPNLEFWGRNFNNGEVIQLVLKSPSTNRWLPFNFVQMVFMHELAHCKEMNHSKAFWTLRNEFAAEMKALWDKGYTGEGLWGKGILLSDTSFSCENFDVNEVFPESMCGGTYRTRASRKRKSRPKLTHKEREEQRIRKKFGSNGKSLGADEEVKLVLENKKRNPSKPKVAGSLRGRELRAAAALSRFETNKYLSQVKEEGSITVNDFEISDEDEIDSNLETEDAIDIDGKIMLDRKGQGMVKVCEDYGQIGNDAKIELKELLKLSSNKFPLHPKENIIESSWKSSNPSDEKKSLPKERVHGKLIMAQKETSEKSINYITCPICSFIDSEASLICTICSNVLKPNLDSKSWKCDKPTCANKLYVNTGDTNFCGICTLRRG